MGKILDSLANGDFCTQSPKEKRTKEHQEACDTAYSLLDKLQKKLGETDNTLLNETIDAITEVSNYSEINQFKWGFQLGALLILEIYASSEEVYEQFSV